MGVLNRLIGEQRKLYQARQRENYYFSEIEKKLQDSDIVDTPLITNEIVFIRNMSGSDDQNSFTGMVKANHIAFSSDFSAQLWGVLWLSIDELYLFFNDDNYIVSSKVQPDPLLVSNRFEYFNDKKANKDLDVDSKLQQILNKFEALFPDIDYLTKNRQVSVISLYCSALYMQVERLKKNFNLDGVLTKAGNLSGISKRGFTKKDFMSSLVTGGKKPIWGGVYLRKEKIKGEGEVVSVLTKASGKLIIKLNISREQATDLEEKIENAGVSSFYLGKKGLAYVTDIRY